MLTLSLLSPLALLAPPTTTVRLGRRAVVTGGAAAALVAPLRSAEAASSLYPPGFEPSRVEGIGGGADVLDERPPAQQDVFYPPSLIGLWRCERTVTSIEGDAQQAEGAWRLLGGEGSIRQPESYALRYIPQPGATFGPDGKMVGDARLQAITGTDGKKYFGVILDRGFELDSRTRGASVSWEPSAPDALSYERAAGGRGGAAELRVLERSVELPSEKGWGSNELLRLRTPTGFGDAKIDYALRVQRRFRRGTTESGARVVEGLEIIKTYRVLDGVAGIEMPTSTTKATLRLTRPQQS